MGRRTVSGGAANVAIEPLLDRLRVELEIPTSYGEETLAQATQVSTVGVPVQLSAPVP